MALKGILSISGYSALFKLIKQSKNGFIVESLTDQKRMQAFASSKVSTLEDIAIYTESGELHLKEIFRKIFSLEEGKKINLNPKDSNDAFKSFFEKALPEYDRERVDVSDIKKVVSWYNLLVEKGLVDLEKDIPEETKEEAGNEKEELKTEEKDDKPEKETKPKKKPVKKQKKEDEKNLE